MQTTLTIDDDVLAAAEQLAARRKQTVGEVISLLSRKSLTQEGELVLEGDGLPLLPRSEIHLRREVCGNQRQRKG